MVVEKQEALNLDVLVHGEPSVTTWSSTSASCSTASSSPRTPGSSRSARATSAPPSSSRTSAACAHDCPLVVVRPEPHQEAMKGMLTGPVTILNWSFPVPTSARRFSPSRSPSPSATRSSTSRRPVSAPSRSTSPPSVRVCRSARRTGPATSDGPSTRSVSRPRAAATP